MPTGNYHLVQLVGSSSRVLGGRLDAFRNSQSLSFSELAHGLTSLGIECAFGTARLQVGCIENGSTEQRPEAASRDPLNNHTPPASAEHSQRLL